MVESFGAWLARKQQGGASAVQPASLPQFDPQAGVDFSAFKKDEKGPMSILNTTLDLLDRPRRAIGETVEAVGNALSAPADEGERGFLDYLGGIATAPFRGLFSTNEEDQTTSSEILESLTDRFGKSYDDRYVDREHNVTPALKGTLGFVGDVASDPLTYIPAAWGIKAVDAAKGLIGRAGAGTADTTARAADEVLLSSERQAVDDVAGRVELPTPTRPLPEAGAQTAPVPPTPGPGAATPPITQAAEEATDVIPTPRPEIEAPELEAPRIETPPAEKVAPRAAQTPESLTASFLDGIQRAVADAPAASAARSLFTQLADDVAKGGIKTEGVSDPAQIAQVASQQAIKALDEASLADDAVIALPAGEIQTLRGALQQRGLAEVADRVLPDLQSGLIDAASVRMLTRSEGAQPKAIGNTVAQYLVSSRALQNADFGDIRGPFEAAVGAIQSARTGAVTPTGDTLAAFLARQTEKQVGETLGPELSAWMKGLSPERFEKVRAGLSDILSNRTSVADFVARTGRDEATGLAALATRLGVKASPRDIATAREVLRQQAARLFDESDPTHSILKPLQKAFDRSFTSADELHPVQVSPRTGRAGDEAFVDVARNFDTSNVMVQHSFLSSFYGELFRKGTALNDEFLAAYRGRFPGRSAAEVRKIFGTDRVRLTADLMTDRYLKAYDDVIDAAGFAPIINMGGAFTKQFNLTGDPIFMSVKDAFGIPYQLAKGTPAEKEVLRAFFADINKAVPAPVLMGTLSRIVEMGDNVDIDELVGLLRQTNISGTRVQWKNGYAGRTVTSMDSGKASGDATAAARKLAEFLASDDVRHALQAAAALGRQRYAQRTIEESYQLSTDALNGINDVVQNGSRSEILQKVAAARHDIADEATEIGALQEASDVAAEITDAALGDATVSAAVTAVRAEKRLDALPDATDAGAARATAVIHDDTARAVGDEVAAAADEADLRSLFDQIGEDNPFGTGGPKPKGRKREKMDVEILSIGSNAALQKAVGAKLGAAGQASRFFNQNFGMPTLNALRLSVETVSNTFSASQVDTLKTLSRKYPASDGTTSTWQKAWRAIQTGDEGALDDAARPLFSELTQVTSRLLPTKADDGFLSSFFYVNNDVAYINEIFDANGVSRFAKGANGGPLLDIDRAKAAVKAGTHPNLSTALGQQWREWDITDVRGFLSTLSYATGQMAESRAMVSQFTDLARRMDGVWDPRKAPKGQRPPKGFVKVQPSGNSFYGAFVDPDLFYDKSLARELAFADEFARMPKRMASKIVTDYYQPLLSTWKFGITVLRPGHHTRNMIGDWSSTWLAFTGGTGYVPGFVKRGDDALRMIVARGRYQDVDSAAALRGLKTNATDAGTRVKVKTKFGELSGDEIYDAAMREGMFPSVAISEDLFFDETGQAIRKNILQTVEEKVRENAVGRFAGGISEYRDHYARLHHFMLYLDKHQQRFGSLDELYAAAAKEVRKYHPDASMLSRYESRYARMVIPFYSWLRGIMPAVFESLVRNPASLTIIPKASYNSAVAMGLNPESIYMPYPEDQLFPSFITEQALGPQAQLPDGTYLNINPGFTNIDVFNEIGGDPVRNLLGMVSPIIRVPAELAAGGQWATGGRISDTSDYLDSSIPVVNYLANISGYSPTSLLVDGGLQQQRGQESGSKGTLDQLLSAGNWVTGLGVQNVSRPSFINYAEIERRNAAEQGQ